MPDDFAIGAGHWMKSPFQANNETVVSHSPSFCVYSRACCSVLLPMCTHKM